MGADRWWRSRTASVEHPRQRLCDRRDRLHRRHAGDPRPRWPQPGRFCLPRHRSAGRAVEAGPAGPGQHRALQAPGLEHGPGAGPCPARSPRACRRHINRHSAAPAARSLCRAKCRRAARTAAQPGRRGDGRAPIGRCQCTGGTGRCRAGPDAAFPGSCADEPPADLARQWPAARRDRSDPRHPLAAGPLRFSAAAPARTDGCADRGPRRHGRDGRRGSAQPHRVAAAVLGRPGHPAGDREIHAVGAAGCALVPQQYRVHPPHQRPAGPAGGVRHRVQRQLPGDGPGRRVPGGAGGHTPGPAPPAGHDQIQPGPHLDTRERSGHRRRLPVRLRHGRAGWLPVRRPHRADVESLARHA